MAKDAKKKKEAKKARTAAKQDKKATKKEKKLSKRPKDADDSDADDADLDAILAEYQRQQEQFLKVTETTSEPPSPRSSATLVAPPGQSSEVFLFGGEYYNGAVVTFYNDLFVYKIAQDSWRKVTSPNTPLPRSGHAMCAGGHTGGIYLFGGEFSSPKQGTFYHYNDFWRLEPATREWTKLETKGKGAAAQSPPARSGHRMCAYKQYIVLFGGFQDTSQQTKYLQDVWLYDTQRYVWHAAAIPSQAQQPAPRSSCSLLPDKQGVVVVGGYSRVKATATTKAGKAAGKSGGGASRVILKPMVHQDSWLLKITPPEGEAGATAAPTVRWERRKKPVNTPQPARAGATMAHHKGRGILFGGVHDVEESEEGMDSEFFNTLYAYNIDRNRFFPLALRRPRAAPAGGAAGGKRAGGGGGRRGRGKADEEELLRNLALIEKKRDALTGEESRSGGGGGGGGGDDDDAGSESGSDDEDDDAAQQAKPVHWEMPHPRFNAQLTVQGDKLFIYGGTYEKGEREFTFDELWALDLGKLDGVREIFRRELEDWQGSEDEDDDEDDEEDDEDDEDDSDEDEAAHDSDGEATGSKKGSTAASLPDLTADAAEDSEPEPEPATPSTSTAGSDPDLPSPRPFESLRAFFARTSEAWQSAVLHALQYDRSAAAQPPSVKEIRGRAFARAEARWWDAREEVQALEAEQEEAGIGEVVSLAERGGGAGGGAGGAGGEGGGAGRSRR